MNRDESQILFDYLIEKSNGSTFRFHFEMNSKDLLLEAILRGFQVRSFQDRFEDLGCGASKGSRSENWNLDYWESFRGVSEGCGDWQFEGSNFLDSSSNIYLSGRGYGDGYGEGWGVEIGPRLTSSIIPQVE